VSMFLCLIHTEGGLITDGMRQSYSRRRETKTRSQARWHVDGSFAALTGSDIPGVSPRIVHTCGWTGVGIAHLHQHAGSTARSSQASAQLNDLERLVTSVALRGPADVGSATGEFAFVCWHPERREIVAARDTFGVWRLHVAQMGPLLAFSTRASALARGENYDLDYFAEYLVTGHGASGHTAFQNVEAIRPAEVYWLKKRQITRTRYWFVPRIGWAPEPGGLKDEEVVEHFRLLLSNSIVNALDRRSDVWSELSGGMDSSSIVATAAALRSAGTIPHGLAGVITYTSAAGSGGDSEMAAAVGQHCSIPVTYMRDWWGWQDDDRGPPLFDQPGRAATYALARRVSQLVHDAGGRVMLSGLGADLCLRPYLDSAADRLAVGDIRGCVGSLLQWAAATRTSFWTLAFDHGLYPLLPARVRQLLARSAWRVPEWIAPAFARVYELRGRTPATALYMGPAGEKVRTALDSRFQSEEQYMHREMLGEENLEWRYPFLDRNLIEFAFSLPSEWRFGSGMSKRVLRESMKGVLPECVRMRRGKGGLQPDQHLSLQREREKLRSLFRDSILGELGCLLPANLTTAIETLGATENAAGFVKLYYASALELWLQSRQARHGGAESASAITAMKESRMEQQS